MLMMVQPSTVSPTSARTYLPVEFLLRRATVRPSLATTPSSDNALRLIAAGWAGATGGGGGGASIGRRDLSNSGRASVSCSMSRARFASGLIPSPDSDTAGTRSDFSNVLTAAGEAPSPDCQSQRTRPARATVAASSNGNQFLFSVGVIAAHFGTNIRSAGHLLGRRF